MQNLGNFPLNPSNLLYRWWLGFATGTLLFLALL